MVGMVGSALDMATEEQMGRSGVRHYDTRLAKRERAAITDDGVPLEPPRPTDIEGRPSVGEDPLLDALIKRHPEKDPANTKMAHESD